MSRFLLSLLVAATALGCSPASVPVENKLPFQHAPPTPELLKLFGGSRNLQDVREARSDSYLFFVDPKSSAVAPGPVMYAGDNLERLTELIGASDSYDWTKEFAKDFSPDVEITFQGNRDWNSSNPEPTPDPVEVFLDRKSKCIEVRVKGDLQGRASFEPMSERLEQYFLKHCSYAPPIR